MSVIGIRGFICGTVLACLLMGMIGFTVAGDSNQGLVYCTQKGSMPYCKHKTANNTLVGYSYAPGTNAKDDDALLCTLTRHNDWYFTWDRRGHGWHNEKTYSYDNCQLGRQA